MPRNVAIVGASVSRKPEEDFDKTAFAALELSEDVR